MNRFFQPSRSEHVSMCVCEEKGCDPMSCPQPGVARGQEAGGRDKSQDKGLRRVSVKGKGRREKGCGFVL